jgi:hypothetical protein
VSLGGSTGVAHSDLNSVSADQHHSKDHDHSESDISTVPNSGLTNSSMTVAGNSVSLGGSTSVDYADLGDTSSFPIPNSDLSNSSVTVSAGNGLTGGGPASLGGSTMLDIDTGGVGSDEIASGTVGSDELATDSVTVAGNTVSLGNSTTVQHGQLESIEANQHHTKPSAGNGLSGGGNSFDVGAGSNISVSGNSVSLTKTVETDGEMTLRANDSNTPTRGAQIRLTDLNDNFSGEGKIFLEPNDPNNVDGSSNARVEVGTDMVPSVDAGSTLADYDLGESGDRWGSVYCENLDESSDARLKDDISDLTDGLERLEGVRPVSYRWKEADDPDQRLGFVAQELEDAVPEAVSRPDDEDGHLGVNNMMVTAVAVDAIQTQQEHIDDLEDENADLRERNADLETRLERVEAELGINTTADRQWVADD